MIKSRFQSLYQFVLNISSFNWVLLGFLISYLLFFVRPIFFSAQVMQFFEYVPALDSIGLDLEAMLSYSDSWFITKQTPYIGNNLYPPLASVLFTPLLSVEFSFAFRIVTLASLLLYVSITFVLPIITSREKNVSHLVMLIFITGLFAYGFQFELERGQFNVIAASMSFFAIWLYHYHNRYRYLAYFLFTISVQLKVYPFIFIVMFITDWHDWKNNIKRILVLSTVNVALFTVLGPYVFFDFIRAIKAQVTVPFIWIGNHSIHSFVTLASNKASEHGWAWVNQFSGLVQLILLAITGVLIFMIMRKAYQQKENGFNSYLFLALTIGALIIPSVSHDYKLSILAAPVAVLFSNRSTFSEKDIRPRQRIIFILLILILSASYSSTLFSFTNKPFLLQNNFPALFSILLAITGLSLMFTPSLNEKKS